MRRLCAAAAALAIAAGARAELRDLDPGLAGTGEARDAQPLLYADQASDSTWCIQGYLGTAWSLPTGLTIHQWGFPDIIVSGAVYAPDAFVESPYSILRLGRWRGDRALEFEIIHQKIRLTNPPPEVQHFEISHGYNHVLLGAAWDRGGFIFRLGGGVLLTHPETVIRDQVLDEERGPFKLGFYLSGFSFQTAIERRFRVKEKFFLALEAKFTAAHAWGVPVAGGDASVPNLALHGTFGFGWEF